MQALETLLLVFTNVTDAGMKDLAALMGLKELDLSGTTVTGAGLKQLAPLKGLQTLVLLNCKNVTDAAVVELHQVLPHCKIVR